MPVIEQSTVIRAPYHIVMETLNDVASIPAWATVEGKVGQIQGRGVGMTYHWRYTFNGLDFQGYSEVIEQTERTLITKTAGDISSIWTITLTPVGIESTTVQVVVEYVSPNIFIELLADLVMEQLNNPDVARENMERFKRIVEARNSVAKAQMMASQG